MSTTAAEAHVHIRWKGSFYVIDSIKLHSLHSLFWLVANNCTNNCTISYIVRLLKAANMQEHAKG